MRFDYMIFFPGRQMGNSLNESVGNYAKEGGSESRARRPPLHSSQRARSENRGLTSDCCAEIIWYFVFHMEISQVMRTFTIRFLLLAHERSRSAHLKRVNAYSAFIFSL